MPFAWDLVVAGERLKYVAYDGSRWIAIIKDGDYHIPAVSLDGKNFSVVGGHDLSNSVLVLFLVYAPGIGWIIGESVSSAGVGGKMWISADGQSWNSEVVDVLDDFLVNQLKAMAVGAGVIVTVTNGGTVYTSTNGNTWTLRDTPLSDPTALVHAGSLFLLGGESSQIFTSPNGTTWTQRTSPLSGRIAGFAYDGVGTYVALSYFPAGCARSSDGVTWVQQDIPIGEDQVSLAFSTVFAARSELGG